MGCGSSSSTHLSPSFLISNERWMPIKWIRARPNSCSSVSLIVNESIGVYYDSKSSLTYTNIGKYVSEYLDCGGLFLIWRLEGSSHFKVQDMIMNRYSSIQEVPGVKSLDMTIGMRKRFDKLELQFNKAWDYVSGPFQLQDDIAIGSWCCSMNTLQWFDSILLKKLATKVPFPWLALTSYHGHKYNLERDNIIQKQEEKINDETTITSRMCYRQSVMILCQIKNETLSVVGIDAETTIPLHKENISSISWKIDKMDDNVVQKMKLSNDHHYSDSSSISNKSNSSDSYSNNSLELSSIVWVNDAPTSLEVEKYMPVVLHEEAFYCILPKSGFIYMYDIYTRKWEFKECSQWMNPMNITHAGMEVCSTTAADHSLNSNEFESGIYGFYRSTMIASLFLSRQNIWNVVNLSGLNIARDYTPIKNKISDPSSTYQDNFNTELGITFRSERFYLVHPLTIINCRVYYINNPKPKQMIPTSHLLEF